MADFFLQKGHTRLGFAGYSVKEQEHNVFTECRHGFCFRLEPTGIFYIDANDFDAGIARVADTLSSGKHIYERKIGYACLPATFSSLPVRRYHEMSDVFASSDRLAGALIEELRRKNVADARGAQIPEDLSFIGYDDLPINSQITDTAVISTKTRFTIELLFRQIEGRNTPFLNKTLDVTLLEWNSVKDYSR